MFQYEYARPSVTATVALIVDGHCVVQVRRGREDTTYPGYWSLPGGFLEAKTNIFSGETVEETAVREMYEELGITIDSIGLNLLGVYSNPDTDPRAHVVNVAFTYNITEADFFKLTPNEEVAEIRLSPYNMYDKLAFNHNDIMRDVHFKVFRA